MRVSDGIRTDQWSFGWFRSYVAVNLITMHGPSGGGGGTSTYVVTGPVGNPCGAGPVTIDMRGTAFVA